MMGLSVLPRGIGWFQYVEYGVEWMQHKQQLFIGGKRAVWVNHNHQQQLRISNPFFSHLQGFLSQA
jgi:hypothetical protein